MKFGFMGKEHLLTKATTKQLGPCQVRSKTKHPCTHQAVAEIYGMPFCGPCAREQEAYFAMGELAQEAQGFGNELLAEVLGRTRGERRRARREESNRALQEAAWQLFVQEEKSIPSTNLSE